MQLLEGQAAAAATAQRLAIEAERRAAERAVTNVEKARQARVGRQRLKEGERARLEALNEQLVKRFGKLLEFEQVCGGCLGATFLKPTDFATNRGCTVAAGEAGEIAGHPPPNHPPGGWLFHAARHSEPAAVREDIRTAERHGSVRTAARPALTPSSQPWRCVQALWDGRAQPGRPHSRVPPVRQSHLALSP